MQVGITKQLSSTNIYKNPCATKQCEAVINVKIFTQLVQNAFMQLNN
jgi:hypothetical protein